MKVLAIDPGVTTGFSITPDRSPDHLWQVDFGTDYPNRPHLAFYEMLDRESPDVIICERFDFRQNKRGVDYTALQYIGVVELYCQKSHTALYFQGQDVKSKKGFWDDKKIKYLGLYRDGKEYEHAMDALRHRLKWEERNGLFDFNILKDLC